MWKAACWIGVTIVAGVGIYRISEAMAESAKQVGKSVDAFLRDSEMMDRFFDNLQKIGVDFNDIEKMRKDADAYRVAAEAKVTN